MIYNYEYYLNKFHSTVPDFTENIPVDLPNGENFEIKITTENLKGLESLEATGLYSQFEKNWEKHYGDFIMSSVTGKTRYMWTILKQEDDCGIVTFYMDKKYQGLAEGLLKNLANLIQATSAEHINKPISGES
jgi:hypothetical protein